MKQGESGIVHLLNKYWLCDRLYVRDLSSFMRLELSRCPDTMSDSLTSAKPHLHYQLKNDPLILNMASNLFMFMRICVRDVAMMLRYELERSDMPCNHIKIHIICIVLRMIVIGVLLSYKIQELATDS